jgi:glycosyltransferase involved in cell wall biosynthesis
VVVPAHNEEHLLPRALTSIRAAAERVHGEVEIVVVANRCTDRTVPVARDAGAVVIENDVRNIAAVRNEGVATAIGDILVTLDADCVMAEAALAEVTRRLTDRRCVGGGTTVRLERTSAGIRATLAVVEVATFVLRVAAGCSGSGAPTSTRSAGSTSTCWSRRTSSSPAGSGGTGARPGAGSP